MRSVYYAPNTQTICEASYNYLDLVYHFLHPLSSLMETNSSFHYVAPLQLSPSPHFPLLSISSPLSWLRAVLVIDDCLKCLPSPLHHESHNFVTLMHSSGPLQGIAPPTTDSISLYISRKCSRKHILLTQRTVRCEELCTDFSSIGLWIVLLQMHAVPMKCDSNSIFKNFSCLDWSSYSMWSLKRWGVVT